MTDEDDLMYWLELEWHWREHQPRFTDKELLAIFPEAKTVLAKKIKDWEAERVKATAVVKDKLKSINQHSPPQDHWFWKAVVKCLYMPAVMTAKRQLARLNRLKNLASDKPMSKNWITQTDIEIARTTPIADLVSQFTKLRKTGKTFIGLCPLHQERTPSFTVYLESNSWHCYGCGIGGDTINLVRELQGLSFLEAVRYLIH